MFTLRCWVCQRGAVPVAVRAGEQMPGEALFGHRAGQVHSDEVVEEVQRLGLRMLAAAAT